MPTNNKWLKSLSGLFFVLAITAVAALLLFDFWHHFQPTGHHRRLGSLALVLVGSSFICLQSMSSTPWTDKFKGFLLGLAFVLWGAEEFLPPGSFVTAVDSLVITIFVADLGLVILGRLSGPGSRR